MAEIPFSDDELASSKVEYAGRDGPISAFLCRPKGNGFYPALIIVHEWWGLNDHIREIATRLSREGFITLAPDLYSRMGHPVTQDSEEAARLMDRIDPDQAVDDLSRALDYLESIKNVGQNQIGIVGFCMGGSLTLLLACRTTRLNAVVPFYGKVADDPELQRISAPLLFIWGDRDEWVTREEVLRLERNTATAKIPGRVKIYPAPHAFFNDTRKEVYDPVAARDAWKELLAFLNQHLRPG